MGQNDEMNYLWPEIKWPIICAAGTGGGLPKIVIASFSITHMGSVWLEGVLQRETAYQPFENSPHESHSLHSYGFTRLSLSKTKKQHNQFSWRPLWFSQVAKWHTQFCGGLLKYAEGFRFGGETWISCFLFSGTFSTQKWTVVFKERGNELGKSKMERSMTADSKDKLWVSREFSQMKWHFCFTKAPVKKPRPKEKSIFKARREKFHFEWDKAQDRKRTFYILVLSIQECLKIYL